MIGLLISIVVCGAGALYLVRFSNLPRRYRTFEAYVCGTIAMLMVIVGGLSIPEMICKILFG